MSEDNVVESYIVVDGELVDANMQPPQSGLQGAFKLSGSGSTRSIVIDMTLARGIARDMIRQARVAAFAKNDAARAVAIDNEDAAARLVVKNKAQQLKNAPTDARITNAATPDALLQAVEDITAEF